MSSLVLIFLSRPSVQAPSEVATLAEEQPSSSPSPFEQVAKKIEKAKKENSAGRTLARDSTDSTFDFDQAWFGIIILLAGGLCARKAIPRMGEWLNRRFNSWEPQLALAGGPADPLVEEASARLASTSRFHEAVPSSTALPAGVGSIGQHPKDDNASREVNRFLAIAPERAEAIRTLFTKLSRVSDLDGRSKVLLDLRLELRAFRSLCELPELRLLELLTLGLEGLFRSAEDKPATLTPSALRTAAGGIIQLEQFSRTGPGQLGSNQRLPRFLVVDDDAISRQAVAASLKKASSHIDLAENGPAALALAKGHNYDVIFLDIEMPGMDGFEVCTEVHKTTNNRETPIVFVTSHSDFDSRTKSAKVGCHDLISKPFLMHEIQVKGLTLVLRGGGSRKPGRPLAAAPAKRAMVSPPPAVKVQGSQAEATLPGSDQDRARADKGQTFPESSAVADLAEAIFDAAPARCRNLQAKLRGLWGANNPATSQEELGELYLELHALAKDSEQAKLALVSRLAKEAECLLGKLFEEPRLGNRSMLETVMAALALIEDLCSPAVEKELEKTPIRILVVDDETVSRRAMLNSLQLGFGQPDCAENGSAAMAMASKQAYDVIFMDVQMPVMDGFDACSKLRQDSLNRCTPVVFVTGWLGLESQAKGSLSGGKAFISKPIFQSQISLAALTFGLRGRLDKTRGGSGAEVKVPVPIHLSLARE